MIIIPAIDLKDGKVVRLIQGDYDKVTVYSPQPAEIAKTWQAQGAKRLHVVDLDGAKRGTPINIDALSQIVKSVDIPVELGGGLRNRKDISGVLDIGVRWVILGTKACEDVIFIEEMVSEFGDKVIVSIDVSERKVAVRGWVEITDIKDVDLIKRLQQAGVKSFIYTDISRDGMLSGSDVENIKRVLTNTGVALIYSGGISSIEDISNLKVLENEGLNGVIIGKALYENKVSLLGANSIAEG